jgi:hypothetical protein
MPTIVACKLPHGLTINHNGQTINLNGSNSGSDPLDPLKNGTLGDNSIVSAGYGLTTLDDKAAEAFADWSNKALYKDGVKDNGPLDEQFLPLANGSILTYKNEADARKDTASISPAVSNGLDGLDGDAEIKKAAAGSPDLVNTGKSKD